MPKFSVRTFVVSRTFLTQDCPGLVRTFLVRTFLVAPQLKTRAVTFFNQIELFQELKFENCQEVKNSFSQNERFQTFWVLLCYILGNKLFRQVPTFGLKLLWGFIWSAL